MSATSGRLRRRWSVLALLLGSCGSVPSLSVRPGEILGFDDRVRSEGDLGVAVGVSRPPLPHDSRGERSGAVLTPSRGGARGRILLQRQPFADAEIRAVRLLEDRSAFGSLGAVREAEEFGGRTDSEGNFRLVELPPGPYRLYVRSDPSERWIRRARARSDVVVVAGKVTVLRDVVVGRVLP